MNGNIVRRKVVCLGALLALRAPSQILFSAGGTGLDYGKAVTVDDAGQVYLAVYFQNTVDFAPGPAASNLTSSSFVDIAFAKYDSGGNLQWAKQIPNMSPTPAQSDIPHGIVLDAATNIYLTGYFSGAADFDPGAGSVVRTSLGYYDTFVARFDAAGDFGWVHTFGNTNAGNATEERNYDLVVEPAGFVYAAGYFEGNIAPIATQTLVSAGGQDGVIVKYEPNGTPAWAFSVGGTTNDQAQALALDGTGHLYVVGSFRGVNVDFDPGPGVSNLSSVGVGTDLFIARYSTNAVLDLAVRVGGIGFEQAAPGGLSVDGVGNLYFTGRFQQTVDFDPGPGVSNLTSVGGDDIFVASYASTGSLRWVFSVGGNGLDGGHRVRLDAETNVVVAGWFTGSADFDGGTGSYVLNAGGTNGGSDAFVAKYDPCGAFLWAKQFRPQTASTNDGIAAGLWVDRFGRSHVTGEFYANCDVDLGVGTTTLTNAGSSDVFLARLDRNGALAGADLASPVLAATGFSFRVQAAAGRTYRIEESVDGVLWNAVLTNTAAGVFGVTVPPAAGARAYRARGF